MPPGPLKHSTIQQRAGSFSTTAHQPPLHTTPTRAMCNRALLQQCSRCVCRVNQPISLCCKQECWQGDPSYCTAMTPTHPPLWSTYALSSPTSDPLRHTENQHTAPSREPENKNEYHHQKDRAAERGALFSPGRCQPEAPAKKVEHTKVNLLPHEAFCSRQETLQYT